MNRYTFLQKLGLGSPLCERYTFIYLYKLVIKHYVVYGMDQVKEKSNLSLLYLHRDICCADELFWPAKPLQIL